jgi:hypothetical protein
MTKVTKPKKQKAVKVVNAKELKAWLRGIQEFQPEGWVPTVEQWDAIRERIFLLEEVEYQVEYQTAHQHLVYDEPHYQQQPAFVAAAPVPAYQAVAPQGGALSGYPAQEEARSSGGIARAWSPTETGVVSVSSASEVLEGEYKSKF